jgi:hypothetical protein
MGFWSTLAKVGKVALPVALAATGVGIPAAAAITAGAGIASKKAQGGSWGDSLKEGAIDGAIGGATAGIGGSLAKSAASVGAKSGLMSGVKSALLNPEVIGGVGATLGGMADASAKNRAADTQVNIQRDTQGIAAARDFENAQQNRAKLELDQQEADRTASTDAYKKALKSALALNMSDVHMNRPQGVPVMEFAGGSRPSAIGAQGKAAAELMNNQAMQHLMDGPQHTAMTPVQKYALSDLPQQSTFEKIAGPAGLGAATLGQIMARLGKRPTATDINEPSPDETVYVG